jgi:hypothetical protein
LNLQLQLQHTVTHLNLQLQLQHMVAHLNLQLHLQHTVTHLNLQLQLQPQKQLQMSSPARLSSHSVSAALARQ